MSNKKLLSFLILLAVVSLFGLALSRAYYGLIFFALLVGLASSAVQVLVPYSAYLAPESIRGRVVGNVMSGLMAGIMLARPVSSFLAEVGPWYMVYYVSAIILIFIWLLLLKYLPPKMPVVKVNYINLLKSMVQLWRDTPILRRRALYHAGLFASFSLFWTTVPVFLMSDLFHFSQGQIALFALAGAAGVFAAPIAGRLADRGVLRFATLLALFLVALCFILSYFAFAPFVLGGSLWGGGLSGYCSY